MINKEIDIKWTPFALNSLDEIYDYILVKENSSKAAIKLVDAIFDRVEQLKTFPLSGQTEPFLKEINQDSRYLIEFSFKIIYEYNEAQGLVIVTDVFHTSQNPDKLSR